MIFVSQDLLNLGIFYTFKLLKQNEVSNLFAKIISLEKELKRSSDRWMNGKIQTIELKNKLGLISYVLTNITLLKDILTKNSIKLNPKNLIHQQIILFSIAKSFYLEMHLCLQSFWGGISCSKTKQAHKLKQSGNIFDLLFLEDQRFNFKVPSFSLSSFFRKIPPENELHLLIILKI